METKIYRHGDVLIKRLEKLPAGVVNKKPSKQAVLAEGEATGHFHRLSCDSASIQLLEHEMARYLVLSDTCRLTHEEHNALSIDSGVYEITMEREWDYIENQRKQVVD